MLQGETAVNATLLPNAVSPFALSGYTASLIGMVGTPLPTLSSFSVASLWFLTEPQL